MAKITKEDFKRILQEESQLIRGTTKQKKESSSSKASRLNEEMWNEGFLVLLEREQRKQFPRKLMKEEFTLNEFKALKWLKDKWNDVKSATQAGVEAASSVSSEFASTLTSFGDKFKASQLEKKKEYIKGKLQPVLAKATQEALDDMIAQYEKAGKAGSEDTIKMELMSAVMAAVGDLLKTSAEGQKKAAETSQKNTDEIEAPDEKKEAAAEKAVEKSGSGSGSGEEAKEAEKTRTEFGKGVAAIAK